MKSINTTNAAATNAALNLKVNHQTRTIEMNKTFADKASRFGSDEYDALMLAREQNPGYTMKVITRKTTKSDKPSYKGLTYEYYDVPIDSSDLIHYETKQIIRYTNLEYLVSTMDAADTGLCYVSRITTMLSVEATAREHGLRPICIWSISNKDYDMSEEQLRVRQTILEDFAIPNEYNLVIINASCETSLKIKSPVDYVIVHSGDDDTQVQVRGRVNNDLNRLYLPSNAPSALTVPAEFLNRKLFPSDKDKLCDCLNLCNESGRQFRWRGVKSRLIEGGYTIIEDREQGRRYAIITEPKE